MIGAADVFDFPDDARWNAERQAVEFGAGSASTATRAVCSGVLGRVFQRLLPERCVEAYYLQRTRFEGIVQRKACRRRQLTEDGDVEISGGSLREVPI